MGLSWGTKKGQTGGLFVNRLKKKTSTVLTPGLVLPKRKPKRKADRLKKT